MEPYYPENVPHLVVIRGHKFLDPRDFCVYMAPDQKDKMKWTFVVGDEKVEVSVAPFRPTQCPLL